MLTLPSTRLAQVLLRLQKKRLGDGADRDAREPERCGTFGCLYGQLSRGGVPALFQGMSAKLLQTVLTSAFMFGTYEQTLHHVGRVYEMLDTRR